MHCLFPSDLLLYLLCLWTNCLLFPTLIWANIILGMFLISHDVYFRKYPAKNLRNLRWHEFLCGNCRAKVWYLFLYENMSNVNESSLIYRQSVGLIYLKRASPLKLLLKLALQGTWRVIIGKTCLCILSSFWYANISFEFFSKKMKTISTTSGFNYLNFNSFETLY